MHLGVRVPATPFFLERTERTALTSNGLTSEPETVRYCLETFMTPSREELAEILWKAFQEAAFGPNFGANRSPAWLAVADAAIAALRPSNQE